MENASKALIIAGAILLSILIIAIGMYIYTSSHNSISEAGSQISEQEKTSFNQQWNTYEGAQGGNNVKSLLQKVIANCNTNKEEDQRLVDIEFGAAASGGNAEVGISSRDGFNTHRYIPIAVSGTATADSYANLLQARVESNPQPAQAFGPGTAVSALTIARNAIEARHTYTITIGYSPTTSLVDLITIVY